PVAGGNPAAVWLLEQRRRLERDLRPGHWQRRSWLSRSAGVRASDGLHDGLLHVPSDLHPGAWEQPAPHAQGAWRDRGAAGDPGNSERAGRIVGLAAARRGLSALTRGLALSAGGDQPAVGGPLDAARAGRNWAGVPDV